MSDLDDRRKGALYGQALGDALGAFYEFSGNLGPGEQAQYRDSRVGFKAGEWTDDTEQAIVLALAFSLKWDDLPKATKLAARGMQHWLQHDGRGCGNHTANVLTDLLYSEDPLAVSEAIWEDGGKKSAPNGGVMRAVGTAIVRPWDRGWTIQAAVLGCKVTHWDPRCVASCVALNVAIRYLLIDAGIETALMEGFKAAVVIEPGIKEYIVPESGVIGGGPISRLALGGPFVGFTYKCIGAGFWALREFQRREEAQYDDMWPSRFLDIIDEVIRAGGDTDTNAAVAGALMGAHIGFENLPYAGAWGTGMSHNPVRDLQNSTKLDAVLAKLPRRP